MLQYIETFKTYPKFYMALGLSLVFFIRKGIQYALIGSYVPILIILSVIIPLVWGEKQSARIYKRVIRFWSVLLMLWAFFRIFMAIVIWFFKSISESHVTAQFTVFGFILSVLFLIFGCFIFSKSKVIQNEKASSN